VAEVSISQQLDKVIAETRPELSADIAAFSDSGEFQRAKEALLDRAVSAVSNSDQRTLAQQLEELAELAIREGDLGMAELYLSEALAIFSDHEDELQVADVYLQMGRVHLAARQRARKASNAYDQLLLSRWKISQNRFPEAEQELKDIVEASLDLDRYGAAASAYETLLRGYQQESNIVDAHKAGVEAINLHAAAGNKKDAMRLLSKLEVSGLSYLQVEALREDIALRLHDYDESVKAIGEARDYAQLYNQMLARDEILQAWRFRRQAEQTLASASKRAQYRRQPDVLVELYRSNRSMQSALTALQKADVVYTKFGLEDQRRRSQQIRQQIY